MERIDEMIISQYMKLNQRIERLKQKKRYIHWLFYQQTFHTMIAYPGNEIVAQAIKADKAIEKLDETLRIIDHQIEIVTRKHNYWQKFLNSLSMEEQGYFYARYIKGYVCLNDRLDRLALEEIEEINQAIVFRYCGQVDYQEPIQLIENDFMGNIDRLLEAVGV